MDIPALRNKTSSFLKALIVSATIFLNSEKGIPALLDLADVGLNDEDLGAGFEGETALLHVLA